MNRIFFVEAHVEEWRCSPSIYADVDFFAMGKDIDDMKARVERANFSLTLIAYKKVEEVSNDERHYRLLQDIGVN